MLTNRQHGQVILGPRLTFLLHGSEEQVSHFRMYKNVFEEIDSLFK